MQDLLTKWNPLAALVACVAVAGCEKRAPEVHTAETVAIYQVPPAVKATIDEQTQGGSVSGIEKRTRNGKTFYSASVLLNGQERKLVIAQDGKLIADGADDDEDDD